MAFIKESFSEALASNANSYTPVLPKHRADDYIVIIGGTLGACTYTSAGYTDGGSDSLNTHSYFMLYKKVSSSNEPNPTINCTRSARHVFITMVVRGADLTNPIDDYERDSNNLQRAEMTIPALTTTQDYNLVVSIGVNRASQPLQFEKQGFTVGAESTGFTIVAKSNAAGVAGNQPTERVVARSSDRHSAAAWAFKSAVGASKAHGLTGGFEFIHRMGQIDPLGSPTPISLHTKVSSIESKTVSPAGNMLIGPSSNSGFGFSGLHTIALGLGGVRDTWVGILVPTPSKDWSNPKTFFTFDLGSIATNFYKVGTSHMYFEDSAGNYAIRKLPEVQVFTFYGNILDLPFFVGSGTVDYSDITVWGWVGENRQTNTSKRSSVWQNIGIDAPLIVTGGGLLNPITTRRVSNAMRSSGIENKSSSQGQSQELLTSSVQIGDGVIPTFYRSPFSSAEYLEKSDAYNIPNNSIDYVVKASANCRMSFGQSILSCPRPQNFVIDPASSTSATYDFNAFIAQGFTVTWQDNIPCNGAQWLECDLIDGKGGLFSDCAFDSSLDLTKAMTVTDGAELINCIFTKGEEIYGVEITEAGTYDFSGTIWIGYDSNSDINVLATSGVVNITLEAGQATPTFTTEGAAVNFILPSKTFTVSVNKTGCDVVILEAGTDTVLASADAQSGTDFVWVYSGAQSVDVGVIKKGFVVNYVYGFNLSGENATLPVTLISDRNYI
jgi:hypothetical protein